LGVILGTILGPDWPKKAPRRVKESYMARFVTMTLLRPCRLSSWLFSGHPGTPQRIHFAGNALKYNKSCPAMAVTCMLYYILWCARAPTKMHHKATPTLLSLFRYPHLLKSRSGFGGLLKDLRVFCCSCHMAVPRRFPEENQDRHHCLQKKTKMLFPFVLALL
jgi:hypothetical protein